MQKNSVLLKEVLTHESWSVRAHRSTIPQSIDATTPNACEKPMLGIADVARNACLAGVFVVIASRRQEAIDSIAPLYGPPKARCVDSES